MLRQSPCAECGSLFFTTRDTGYLCLKCKKRIKKANARENRRIREFMMLGSHTETEWMFQIERQMSLCFYCDKPLRDEQGKWRGTRDHLTPIARGGTDNIDNIVAACWPCNKKKGNRTLGEYRTYLFHEQCKLTPKPSAIPPSTIFAISTEEWPPVCVLNPELQAPFLRLMGKQEAAALAFKGVDITERRRQVQSQIVEVYRRYEA
jgi:5-methylcytosine-specific restriction endonuclease McrA